MSDTQTTHHVLLHDDAGSPFCYDQSFTSFEQWALANTPAVQLTDTQNLLDLGIVTIIASADDAAALGQCPVVQSINVNRL